jgi:hypothetical protein
MLKPLPVGIQTFRDIIDGGFLYIDKTRYIYELIRYPKGVYFLSRPRRFGKSLLISTLAEIFTGERERFQGLWLYDSPYQWQKHPVIRLDFSRRSVKTAEQLETALDYFLAQIARSHALKELQGYDYQSRFDDLIMQLGQQRQIVILIDEYDKPIIDNLDNLDEAKRIREVLKTFYTIIKSHDQYIRFVFLTGVSKFSRVGIFPGLNNLEDLSLRPAFATLLGLTEAEISAYLQDYITAFAEQQKITNREMLQQIRHWYNGFCFAADSEPVYNPFSTFLLFKEQRFSNYWFETGTPTFLIDLIKRRRYDLRRLEQLELNEQAFSTYELEQLELTPLLFQTGYLTIKGYQPDKRLYRLAYPNYEVEEAFLGRLLSSYSLIEKAFSDQPLWQLVEALQNDDLKTFFDVLKVFFANIPYDIQLPYEKYYQSVFYLIFALLGLRIEAEKRTQRGRIDTVVEFSDRIYLFEFKLDGSAETALQQIREKGYAEGYRGQAKTIYSVGVGFDSRERSVSGWKLETIKA